MSTATVHPVDERLPIGKLAPPGLQHVLVMYAGAIIGAGVLSMLLAPILGRLLRCFPPVVTGALQRSSWTRPVARLRIAQGVLRAWLPGYLMLSGRMSA